MRSKRCWASRAMSIRCPRVSSRKADARPGPGLVQRRLGASVSSEVDVGDGEHDRDLLAVDRDRAGSACQSCGQPAGEPAAHPLLRLVCNHVIKITPARWIIQWHVVVDSPPGQPVATGLPRRAAGKRTTGVTAGPGSPDPDALLGVEPEAVALAGPEDLVELVEVAHDVGAELRRAVRVDGEVLLLLLLAALGPPAVGPVQEQPCAASPRSAVAAAAR